MLNLPSPWNKTVVMKLILASQSVQRKKIMNELGLNFKIIPAHIDEHHSGYKRPHKIVQSIALRKAQAISKKHPNSWVVGADTIVVKPNRTILLKPKSKQEAKEVIMSYSQSHCDVYTGLAVTHGREGKWVGYEKTRIHFFQMDEKEIDHYLEKGNWGQSSGSLSIEEVEHWVKKIEGSYSNILGLPSNQLKKVLKKAGYR